MLPYLSGLITLVSPTICSHAQSIQYYKASIHPTECEFVGHLCEDYETFNRGECSPCDSEGSAIMGMDIVFQKNIYIDKNVDHKYYLNTTLTYPYCRKYATDTLKGTKNNRLCHGIVRGAYIHFLLCFRIGDKWL